MNTSIIIITNNKINELKLVLLALEQQMNDNVEVIIVLDGGAFTDTKRINGLTLKYQPKIICLENSQGRCFSRNAGAKYSNGELLIFLDGDRIPSKNFISKHIEIHKKYYDKIRNKRCVLIGERKNLSFTEDEKDLFFNKNSFTNDDFAFIEKISRLEFSDIIRKIIYKFPFCKSRWLPFVAGNISIKKDDFNRVRGFDELFKGWGWEENEFALRLKKIGLVLIREPLIKTYHIEHFHDIKKIKLEENINFKYFIKKIKKDIISYIFWNIIHIRHRIIFFFKTKY